MAAGTLKVRVNDEWVPVVAAPDPPPAPDEVLISPVQPRDVATELWVDTTDVDDPILKAKIDGLWVELGNVSEVAVANTDPYVTNPQAEDELWYDTGSGVPGTLYARAGGAWVEVVRYGPGVAYSEYYGQEPFEGTQNSAARVDHVHGTPPEEVAVADSDPIASNPDLDVWFDPVNKILYVRADNTWVPVGSDSPVQIDEVHVGPSDPRDATTEIWIDNTTEPPLLKANIEGVWTPIGTGEEVSVSHTDPYTTDANSVAELWYDTGSGVPGVLYVRTGGGWVPVQAYGTSVNTERNYGEESSPGSQNSVSRSDHTHGTPPEEVVIDSTDPITGNPDVEFWYDTSLDPAILKANVNGTWVEVTSGDPEPPLDEVWVGTESPDPVGTYELWVDLNETPPLLKAKMPNGSWEPLGSAVEEVVVGDVVPDDPGTKLFYDTTINQLMVQVEGAWRPVDYIPPNEVYVGTTPPTPDVELWYDPAADGVNADEVVVSSVDPDSLDPANKFELWVDTTATSTTDVAAEISILRGEVISLREKLAEVLERLDLAGDILDGEG